MSRIIINRLGPIEHCELAIDDFMVLTGPQSSGKSTIAKSVFLFKHVKNILLQQLRKQHMLNADRIDLPMKDHLIRELRSVFLQTFGSTWCMDKDMTLYYEYTDEISITVFLKEDPVSPNYIWIELSRRLDAFLG